MARWIFVNYLFLDKRCVKLVDLTFYERNITHILVAKFKISAKPRGGLLERTVLANGQIWTIFGRFPLENPILELQNRDFFAPAAGFPPYKSMF